MQNPAVKIIRITQKFQSMNTNGQSRSIKFSVANKISFVPIKVFPPPVGSLKQI